MALNGGLTMLTLVNELEVFIKNYEGEDLLGRGEVKVLFNMKKAGDMVEIIVECPDQVVDVEAEMLNDDDELVLATKSFPIENVEIDAQAMIDKRIYLKPITLSYYDKKWILSLEPS